MTGFAESNGASAGLDQRPAAGDPSELTSDPYISHLLSYTLDTLSKEPSALKNRQDALKLELEDTAIEHYQGFINAATCFHEINSQVQAVHKQLHALADEMKALHACGDAYVKHSKDCQRKRDANRTLLAQHGTLLELLELPQLIDTCIRNANFDEALDLLAFVQKLGIIHSEAAVVQQLLQDVKACRALLLEQQVTRLSGNVTLPDCLRSVSYLRRMAVFSEPELRYKFLECRESWFESVAAGIDESSAASYLRQLTDAYRLHFFDILMQYRAIFAEEGAAAGDGSSSGGCGAPRQQHGPSILFGWAQQHVRMYVDAVERHLPRIQDGSTLAALAESCMYCGRSLSRVGLDFRGLLHPAFASAALSLFSSGVARAMASLAAALASHRWVFVPVADGRSGALHEGDAPAEERPSAAYSLLKFPPLAVFANAIILSFNNVRGLALLSISASAAEHVQGAVRQACAMLTHAASANSFSEAERQVHVETCKAMIDVACPLLVSMFQQLFGPGAPRLELGEAVAPLQELMTSGVPAATPLPASRPGAQTAASARAGAPPRASREHPAQAAHRLAPQAHASSNLAAPVQCVSGDVQPAPDGRIDDAAAAAEVPASTKIGNEKASSSDALGAISPASRKLTPAAPSHQADRGTSMIRDDADTSAFAGFDDDEGTDDEYDDNHW